MNTVPKITPLFSCTPSTQHWITMELVVWIRIGSLTNKIEPDLIIIVSPTSKLFAVWTDNANWSQSDIKGAKEVWRVGLLDREEKLDGDLKVLLGWKEGRDDSMDITVQDWYRTLQSVKIIKYVTSQLVKRKFNIIDLINQYHNLWYYT